MICFSVDQDEECAARRLNYFAYRCWLDRNHLLTNFDDYLKDTVFDRCLRLKPKNPFFVNWQRIDYIDIPPARQRELFVDVTEWWMCHHCSSL